MGSPDPRKRGVPLGGAGGHLANILPLLGWVSVEKVETECHYYVGSSPTLGSARGGRKDLGLPSCGARWDSLALPPLEQVLSCSTLCTSAKLHLKTGCQGLVWPSLPSLVCCSSHCQSTGASASLSSFLWSSSEKGLFFTL